MLNEFIQEYGLAILMGILTTIGSWLGVQVKRMCEKYINDKTKKAVVNIAVQAVEQLYKELHGAEKLGKAKEGALEMLSEKGIIISNLELELLIESTVGAFNANFKGGTE